MKKNNAFFCFFVFSIMFFSCSKKIEKPKISINQYNVQITTIKGVVAKILGEEDYKKRHEIALAIESSRAVSCILVSEECNVLGQILNKIVKSTADGPPSASDNNTINNLVHELDRECKKGQEKLARDWKEYINIHAT